MAFQLNMGATKTQSNQDDRPQADIWLNVGYTAKNGEGEEIFVGLPMGLALDTMKPSPMRGSNEDYRNLVQAKNELMKMLLAAAEEMRPGQEEIVTELKVQIRRRNEAEDPVAGENPLMAGVTKLNFSKAS